MSPPQTLVGHLRRNAENSPTQIALDDELGHLTWSQLWEQCASVAGGLADVGVRPADTVAIVVTNRREFILSWFAIAMLGATEVPLDPFATPAHRRHILTHVAPRVVVAESRFAAEIEVNRREAGDFVLVAVGEAPNVQHVSWSDVRDSRPADSIDDPDPSALGSIMYTSGTSGPAKGVMMPFGQQVMNGSQAIDAARISAADCVLVCLPLHHNMAQGYGVLPAVMTGARIRLLPRFDRRTFWETAVQSGATVFPFVGGLLHLLLANETALDPGGHGIRIAYGVPVPARQHQEFESRFGLKVLHGYGSTEATIPVWQDADDRAIGSAGRVLPGYSVECRDADDGSVGPDISGEICVHAEGANAMFLGYWRDPAATALAVRDGWFHTGDRGHFDLHGNLWFDGRMTDSIRRFGEFIDPAEIEDVAVRHPAVLHAAAFGVASPVSEQDVMLVVTSRGAPLDLEELRGWLSAELPRRSVPRFIEVLPSLPTTSTGKVEKYRLRERGVTATTSDFRTQGANS